MKNEIFPDENNLSKFSEKYYQYGKTQRKSILSEVNLEEESLLCEIE